MKLKHFYHMYADGLWQAPFNEHLTALKDSGLLEELDFIGVGIVGSEANRTVVKKLLPSKFHVVAESKSGWEQVTHTPLAKDLLEPSKIFYAHTKGASNNTRSQGSWRQEMTNGTVYHWRECVDLLDKYDAVGCRWQRHPWRHFSGTFWWATSSYLSTLAPISYNYRDEAEAWIGQGSVGGTHVSIDPSQSDLNPTVYSFGRTFVSGKTIGHSYLNLNAIGPPLPGDEFVGFSPMDGNSIIAHLIMNGATCSMIGDTIIVKTVA